MQPTSEPTTTVDSGTEVWREIGEEERREFDEFEGVSLRRGSTGVFDVEDLVDILRLENLQDVAVIRVPKEAAYVDHMVVATAKSARQMLASAEFVRRVFKKRSPGETPPVVEGRDSRDWIAMDLGNVALHVFSKKARRAYDLETLWTCGAEHDDLSNQPADHLSVLLKKYSFPTTTTTQ